MLLRTVNPGKPSINGPFSMAMLNNQRVTQHMLYIYTHRINGYLGYLGYLAEEAELLMF